MLKTMKVAGNIEENKKSATKERVRREQVLLSIYDSHSYEEINQTVQLIVINLLLLYMIYTNLTFREANNRLNLILTRKSNVFVRSQVLLF